MQHGVVSVIVFPSGVVIDVVVACSFPFGRQVPHESHCS
jgi:hypothetical protein